MQNTIDPKFLLELSQLIPSGVLLDDYGDPVNIAIPRQYASMPNLSEIPGHTTHDLNKIKDYFTNLLNGSYRINKINELEDYNDVVNCDYCRGSCIGSYYRCTECDLNMCSLCYGETSEAIALQHGALHYYSRKDKLDKCRSHGDDILVKMPLDYEGNVCAKCTLCKYSIKGSCFYTDINSAIFDEGGKLISIGFSVCYDCYTSDRRLSTQENFLDLTKVDNIFVDRKFGSILDWVPLYEDEKDPAIILMNLNPDSIAFFKVALCSIDDHSRMGWFISKNPLEKTIEDLKSLQSKDGIYCELAETDEDNKGPIKMLMEEEDFPVYYG